MHNIKIIAINAWILRNLNIDGIGNFTIQTTQNLAKINPKQIFYVLTDWNYSTSYFTEYPNIKIKKIFPPRRHPFLYIFFMEIVLPIYLLYNKIDVFIGMDGMLSLLSSKKQIAVIHDLNFFHYPRNLPFRNRLFYNIFYPLYAKKSKSIITVSEFTKQDIIKSYKINPNKITVVYCAAKSIFHPVSEMEKRNIKIKHTSGKPFFIFIGSIHPRKNLENTIKAFAIFLKKANKDFKLILVGNFLWNNKKIFNLIDHLKINNHVLIKGRLTDSETNDLLASAEALIFMSYFEGFGIPILEAFSTETPVICSNTTSINEISENAALKAPPNNPEEISEKMLQLTNSNELRKELVKKGTIRNKDFSWEKTAELLYKDCQKYI